MNIYSALTAPSSISPASGFRFGGVFETRSRLSEIKAGAISRCVAALPSGQKHVTKWIFEYCGSLPSLR
jgi:hypothetical protein